MAFFPEFLHYSRNERKGIFALVILIILLALIPKMLPYWVKEKTTDFSKAEQQIANISTVKKAKFSIVEPFIFDPNTISKDSLILLGISPKTAQTILNYRKKIGRFSQKEDLQKIYTLSSEAYQRIENFIQIKPTKKKISTIVPSSTLPIQAKRFNFDPNTSSKEELLSLGLSKKVVKTLLNFREKGGHFYKKADLQKIYGLKEALFYELEPFIHFAAVDKNAFAKTDKKEVKLAAPPTIIDINKASVADWQQLNGIGPTYAKRIVNFRQKLGGFSSTASVGDIYGIPDSIFQKIKPFLILSPILKKIKINVVTADELKTHPFIKWKQATAIIYYRQNHGNFATIDDFKKIRALNVETVQKITPYLDFE